MAETGPKWWELYLTFPLLIVLFMLDAHLKISTRGHQVVQIGIILLVYGLIYIWVNANASALLKMDRSEHRARFTTVHFLTFANNDIDSMFAFSNREMQSTFAYTSEIQSIDLDGSR
jgi:hypothetical protein